MNLDKIEQMLMQSMDNNQPYQDYMSTAVGGINNQTKKRIRALLSKFSNTGMARSGISGAAENDIYSNAGEQIQNVSAQGGLMQQQNRNQILAQLLGLAEYQDSKPGFLDFLGGIGGNIVGSATGGLGTAIGSKLAKLL